MCYGIPRLRGVLQGVIACRRCLDVFGRVVCKWAAPTLSQMPGRRRTTGGRLTKAYDVTIPRYRKSQRKIKVSKMHILRYMGSKFCVKFQRCTLKFHTNFWTHTAQNMHFTTCFFFFFNLTSYDILELWRLKSQWDGSLKASPTTGLAAVVDIFRPLIESE